MSNTYVLTISQNLFSNRFIALFANYSLAHNVSLPVDASRDALVQNYAAVQVNALYILNSLHSVNRKYTFQVYFSTLQYISIKSNPAYSFMALLSDVGGALGLLLGATILTFIEIAEFGWEMMKFWYVTRIYKPHRREEKPRKKTNARNRKKPAVVPVII